MNSMDKKSRVLLGALLVAALASLGTTFFRTVVHGDFVVTEYYEEEEVGEEVVEEEESLEAAEDAGSDETETEDGSQEAVETDLVS